MVASNAGAAQGAATSYFSETGDSLARVQCRSPLQWSRSFGQASAEPAVRPVLHAERSRLGLDYPAAVGMPVLAAGSGKVVAHGPRPGVGNTVVLAHPGGTETIYQHLSRIPRSLVDGQQVKFRQVIGYVGQTGPVPKPHLHFAVRVGNRLIDPTKWRPAREVPLPDSKRVALAESVAELSELMVRAGESSPDAASSQLTAALPSQP
jgi:murein DD-endopeptidase MepM/ murein hydrolase activator NlpD